MARGLKVGERVSLINEGRRVTGQVTEVAPANLSKRVRISLDKPGEFPVIANEGRTSRIKPSAYRVWVVYQYEDGGLSHMPQLNGKFAKNQLLLREI